MTVHTPLPIPLDLTQHEVQALKTRYNLADAHTHQGQSPSQHRLVADLPAVWYEAERTPQAVHERRFLETFFEFRGQPAALRGRPPLISYAASISTLVVGLYLARRHKRVSLVEPCFDNLADILRCCGVELRPLPEEALHHPSGRAARLANVDADALFLVDPNNPTGFSLLREGRVAFEEIARLCKAQDKLLILDFCFASFATGHPGQEPFDVYELLDDVGVSYIAIEDTGKTWPVQDAKAAVLCCSDDLYDDLYNIHTSVLLNVSPFVLGLLTGYVRDSIRDRFGSVRDVLQLNRDRIRAATEGTLLAYRAPVIDVSVAWFEITEPSVTATDLHRRLLDREVYALPGTYFYWSSRAPGERFLRVALARDPDVFVDAAAEIRHVLDEAAR